MVVAPVAPRSSRSTRASRCRGPGRRARRRTRPPTIISAEGGREREARRHGRVGARPPPHAAGGSCSAKLPRPRRRPPPWRPSRARSRSKARRDQQTGEARASEEEDEDAASWCRRGRARAGRFLPTADGRNRAMSRPIRYAREARSGAPPTSPSGVVAPPERIRAHPARSSAAPASRPQRSRGASARPPAGARLLPGDARRLRAAGRAGDRPRLPARRRPAAGPRDRAHRRVGERRGSPRNAVRARRRLVRGLRRWATSHSSRRSSSSRRSAPRSCAAGASSAFVVGAILVEVATYRVTSLIVHRERPTVPRLDHSCR